MREILFKAKLKDWKTNPQQNKWVEGYYLSKKETTYCFAEDYEKFPVKTLHYIAVDSMTDWGLPNEFRCYEIDPDTLCQYTGLTDKKENKIWENDICNRNEKFYEIVKCIQGDYVLDYSYGLGKEEGSSYCNLGFYVCERGSVEVIGNIFDNPELLKSEFYQLKVDIDDKSGH